MSNSIITNGGALAAYQALARANETSDRVSRTIGSGYKIDTPFDDGATFAVAAKIRGDIEGWEAVRERQQVGRSIVQTAVTGATTISDMLIELKADVVKYAGSTDEEEREQYRTAIDRRLSLIGTVADNSVLNEINLLVPNDTAPAQPPTPAQPASFSGTVSGGGPGQTTTTFAAGADPGTVVLSFNVLTGQAQFQIRYGNKSVASTQGPTNTGGTLTFAYPASPTQDIDIRVNAQGPSATWSYSLQMVFPPPPPLPPGSGTSNFTVLRNLAGDTIEVENQDLTLSGLGLEPLDLDPAAVALVQMDNALEKTGTALNYFAAKHRRIENSILFGSDLADALTRSLGILVDADLPREAALLESAKAQQQLASQGLAIANAAPQVLLSLFR